MKESLKGLSASRWTRITLTVMGVVMVLGLGAFLTGVFDPPQRLGEKKVDPNRCPECNMALSRYARDKGECLFCHANLPGKSRDLARQGQGKVLALILIVLCSLLLLVNAVFFFRGRARKRALDEELYHLRCRKCDRKIRYRTGQAGQFARCPQCRQMLRFPELARDNKRPWWRLWHKNRQAV